DDLADRVDAQPAILELRDQLQPVGVRVAVIRDAAADLGTHERAARLVEADRARRHAGLRGQLVDGHRAHAASRNTARGPSSRARRLMWANAFRSWLPQVSVLYATPLRSQIACTSGAIWRSRSGGSCGKRWCSICRSSPPHRIDTQRGTSKSLVASICIAYQ